MSEPSSELREQSGAGALVADLAQQAVGPHPVVSGRVEDGRSDLLVWTLNEGQDLKLLDLEAFLPHPSRKAGTVQVTTDAALITYTKRHLDPDATTLWADITTGTVVAVIDDHADQAEEAGWAEHRAVLRLAPTPDWTHWTKLDNQLVVQERFAEHIEDGADAVTSPDAATMLEIAQSFHAKRGVTFRSSSRLDNGEVQFLYEETVAAKAGQRGQLSVPDVFSLALQPFEGSKAYTLYARFRYRLVDGQLRLGYRLVRPDRVREQAFDDICTNLQQELEVPVLAGLPRPGPLEDEKANLTARLYRAVDPSRHP